MASSSSAVVAWRSECIVRSKTGASSSKVVRIEIADALALETSEARFEAAAAKSTSESCEAAFSSSAEKVFPMLGAAGM